MKLLCVITGGTFSSNHTSNGIGINADTDVKFLLNAVKKYCLDSVEVDFITPIFKLSENMDDRDWNIINHAIEKKIDEYDSILVLHGTDTMTYTACALSYNEKISKKKPIVLTGANIPLSFENTDAIVNFIQSILVLEEFIKSNIIGVFIVFNGSNSFNNKAFVHLGVRAKKYKWEGDCYMSFYIDELFLGYYVNKEYKFDLKKYNQLFNKDISYKQEIIYESKKISSFKIYAGFDSSILKREFDYGKRYFILEVYSSGTAPIKDTYLSLYESLKYINANKGIVFIISQQEGNNGITMDIYESSHILMELNVIPLKNMLWESAIVKLMSASSLDNNQEIIDYMLSNISGEINSP